ncbi:ATP-grasp domain-containing protein [Ottowia thiooxydans]|uniref:ATP-grasp domain-containing protein n=1 Tax=Ottowia thiooxydans TaxID=219182 RepID=UPI000407D688|nr:ATP-grasp domain-containing protein [Ottowia thiooxydans]
MQLIEFDGKALLENHGIPVLHRCLLAPDEPAQFSGDAMVKAQILSGGRGKAGLIKRADVGSLARTVDALRALLNERGEPGWLMLEQPAQITAALYIAFTIDDVACAPCLLFSCAGGVEVESHPEQVQCLLINPLKGLVAWKVVEFLRTAGLEEGLIGPVSRFALELWRVWCAEDAELIEINPLAVTPDRKLVALDAKIILDDHAEARHPHRYDSVSSRLNSRGRGELDTFVEMPGSIGLLTGGAGLGMTVVDMLADAGLHAANFVDGSGGNDPAVYENKAKRILQLSESPAIKGVLVYFTLAAASLAPIVRGTIKALQEHPTSKPVVVGIVAAAAAEAEMTAIEAKRIFVEAGFAFVPELDEAIAELSRQVKAGASSA